MSNYHLKLNKCVYRFINSFSYSLLLAISCQKNFTNQDQFSFGPATIINSSFIGNSTYADHIVKNGAVFLIWAEVPYDLSKSDLEIVRLDTSGIADVGPVTIAQTSSINTHPLLTHFQDQIATFWFGEESSDGKMATLNCSICNQNLKVLNTIHHKNVYRYSTGGCVVSTGSAVFYLWSTDEIKEDFNSIQIAGVAWDTKRFFSKSLHHSESAVIRFAFTKNDTIYILGQNTASIFKGAIVADMNDTTIDFVPLLSEQNTHFFSAILLPDNRIAIVWWQYSKAYLSLFSLTNFQEIHRSALTAEKVFNLSNPALIDTTIGVAWVDSINTIKSLLFNIDENSIRTTFTVSSDEQIACEPRIAAQRDGLLYYWRSINANNNGGVIVTRLLKFTGEDKLHTQP